jgi:ABC-type multidrug transport system fused ATPase/permease subunit
MSHDGHPGSQSTSSQICFVVAQRISTVLKADKIVVIDQGRVAALGTHRQLLESSPIYQEIFASQLGEGRNGVNKHVDPAQR